MSDRSLNHELDDELLSAYLDGELSADKRAAVEARLATDPAAQQLLHELRSVSQSVQALPTESLGRDLSGDIIRRAREAAPLSAKASSTKSVPASDDSLRFIEAMPKIRAFNSKRAWIWASMTVAAGLLFMIVRSGDESTKKLPNVAARNPEGARIQPVDEADGMRRRQISISAAPESTSAPAAAVASDGTVHQKVDAFGAPKPAAPMSSEPLGGQLSSSRRDGAATGTPVAAPDLRKEVEKTANELDDASSAATALSEQVATDKRAAGPQPSGRMSGRMSGAGGVPGMSAEKQKSEAIVSPATQQLFVVRVVAKPEALEKRSFERLLADNKIEFVPQPAKTESLSFGGGKLAKRAQSESTSKDQSNKAAAAPASKMEMVLVEAPAPAIESCLADLNKNANDFVSITVNEEQQSQDRFDAKSIAAKSTMAKSLVDAPQNLSRFSRGAAPEAQKDTVDVRKYFYSYDFDKPNDSVANGSPRAGGFGSEATKNLGVERDANGDKKKRDDKGQLAPDIRRARRIDTWGMDNRQAGETASAGPSSPKSADGRTASAQSISSRLQATNQPTPQRKSSEQLEAKTDNSINNLKVLFVFTPEETPAPVAPSDNRPK